MPVGGSAWHNALGRRTQTRPYAAYTTRRSKRHVPLTQTRPQGASYALRAVNRFKKSRGMKIATVRSFVYRTERDLSSSTSPTGTKADSSRPLSSVQCASGRQQPNPPVLIAYRTRTASKCGVLTTLFRIYPRLCTEKTTGVLSLAPLLRFRVPPPLHVAPQGLRTARLTSCFDRWHTGTIRLPHEQCDQPPLLQAGR
jgi:hypothetical protein